MTLALIVPVHNDADGLSALLQRAVELDCFDQVVIVDDASDIPLSESDLPESLRDRSLLLRSDESGGAGHARNRALEVVDTESLLFFDSDDLLTGELPCLWRELQGRAFDFCLFKHHDSRVLERDGWGQMPVDNMLWRLAGVSAGGLRVTDSAARPCLAETANYPWNKIYRTGFLRENRLKFSEIPVHNDIAVHWDSFSCAENILVSDRVAAIHFVRPGGQRLTNRRSRDRLRVFEPLRHAAEGIRDRQGAQSPLMLALIRFSFGLMNWVRGNIPENIRGEYDRRAAGFIDCLLDEGRALDWLNRRDPVLCLKILLMQAQGRGIA